MEWINIKDKLPKDNERVIMCDSGGMVRGGYFINGECWNEYFEVTHWMPLPENESKEWIDINNQTPRDSQIIVILCDTGEKFTGAFVPGNFINRTLKYWMPLPHAPERPKTKY